ncbi:MAG: hypothetical protein AAF657_29260, partial [Acidobacteriota bacterium]
MSRRARTVLLHSCLAGGCIALGLGTAGAAEVKIFRTDSREAVLKGTLDGVSTDSLGGIELARDLERLATLEEPYVFSAAALADGWAVGTGNSGKVLKVGREGEVSELYKAAESEVFALHAEKDGAVLAATSPNGKVYRLADGEADVVYDGDERYLWALARDAKGRLLVATGLPGRLVRVGKGAPEVLYESRDSHVRAIAVLPTGAVLLGTAGEGLIVRLEPDGQVTTVHDAAHPEILSIVTTPNGTAYAAALASEASYVDLSKSADSSTDSETESGGERTVTVSTDDPGTIGSRSSTFSGPRSVILEISPSGG